MHCYADLLKIVLTGGPPGRFAGRLHRRQQERNQRADDSDYHQQLYKRKTV